ncbi:MAG: hypothetical protein IPH75_14430 [bacterium]|nr:hypothetical protein [bacterium]
MNYYHIWVNLKDSHRDLEFCDNVHGYLGALRSQQAIEGYTITRRKFGFGPSDLGEFHIVIQVRDLPQLESAFSVVARRTGEIEDLHRKVYSAVTDFRSALYRDFPDKERVR